MRLIYYISYLSLYFKSTVSYDLKCTLAQKFIFRQKSKLRILKE